MSKPSQLHIGSPIYVQRGEATITLVPEVAVTGGPRSRIVPSAVFVIDERGVSRLTIADRRGKVLAAMALSGLLSTLPYFLFSRRAKSNERIYKGK